MVDGSRSRGSYRDRHGRGSRQLLLSPLFRTGSRNTSFAQIVNGACEFLQSIYPDELNNLKWQVRDAPKLGPDAVSVTRWSVRHEDMTIIIYRLPIERLGHVRRSDALHERMHIEECVFSAVAKLLGKEPWELMDRD
jgi:hypothetical protein